MYSYISYSDPKNQELLENECLYPRYTGKVINGKAQQKPCGRVYCPCQICRDWRSMRDSREVEISSEYLPVDYYITICKVDYGFLQYDQLNQARIKIWKYRQNHKSREHWRAKGLYVEWRWDIDTTPEQPGVRAAGQDINWLIRSNMFQSDDECASYLIPMAQLAFYPTQMAFTKGPVESQIGLANYATGHVAKPKREQLPEDWEGKRITWYTRGFHAKARKDLWKEAIEKWDKQE